MVGQDIESGIYKIVEALKMADEMGLDLVEISPSANQPVCKIVDYQKLLYEQHSSSNDR